jgi:O-antigen/teichoic acid export membrane protein
MGIVFKQSLSNTVVTYLGFGIGAVNTLFLYTRFLTPEYYGLVGVILSTSAILMPLLAFGVPNTMIKYFSSFRERYSADGFLTLMMLLPLAVTLPVALLSYLANDMIGLFLSHRNVIVRDYIWNIFLVCMGMAYFEVFYSWSKVQMKSVYGNFMKEVFVRLGVTVLLLAIFLEIISVTVFLNLLVGLYLIRTVLMMGYAFSLRRPEITFTWPRNTRTILQYSFLIIFGGSASVLLLELDRFMINQFIAIENVAYYSVAVFIATVIAVPFRSMHQVTYPITAEIMNNNNRVGLKRLYQKSSLTLYIISGLIYILIVLNLEDLYLVLPAEYRGGYLVVCLIGLVRVFDAALGINSAILYNSDYYRSVLLMGFVLAILIVLLNLWLIPLMGMNGAALASLLAMGIYDSIKLYYVWRKFGIQPFSNDTLKVTALLLVLGTLFYFIRIPLTPFFSILAKSLAVLLIYFLVLYRYRISEDVFVVMTSLLQKTRGGKDNHS